MGESLSERARARVALIGLTVLWGSTFVVVQSGVRLLSPCVLIALRFLVAALFLLLLRPGLAREARRAFLPALPLSLLLLAGFYFQTVGLQSTTPARSAFITSLSVVMVPAVEILVTRRLPARHLLAAVALATLGVYVLFRPIGLEWRGGDTWTLCCAVAFALYIVELARMSRRHDAAALVLAQSVAIAGVSLGLAPLAEASHVERGWPALAVVLYLGVVCTALTFFLMTWGQARVAAVEAAVIYILEPLLATAFSIALGREPLTLKVFLGGGLIMAAMVISGLGPSRPRS